MKQKVAADDDAKKAEAAKKALKEKDYAPPPPEWVLQPPIAKGGLAEKFKTGRCLGKGGFAICYEGELRGRKNGVEKRIFALKVVKAAMSQRKMEEKVCRHYFRRPPNANVIGSSALNYKYTQKCSTRIL